MIACRDCAHFRRPGKSDGYCAGDREDLPRAYGDHHPLRKLPEDGGENCAAYTLKPALKGTAF